ncbi:MAG TPA: VOC family protein [Rhizomicrobium sp.]|jgi:uncharacterized glyoxalase superfamily protein PhnB|nr:VOC family protein [Rhizomicrobium sp.]
MSNPKPVPDFDLLRKQAKQIVRWHREGNYSVAVRIRAGLPRYAALDDAQILAADFRLAEAQALIAREFGFDSWATLKTGLKTMPEQVKWVAVPTITAAFPQLFVADIDAACAYYEETLGFATVFRHGQPAFYGQVKRDAARLNLRYVDRPLFDPALRDKEMLLSAYLPVENVKSLFLEFKDKGAGFRETLKEQPWGAQYFIVRDPDGNLICFASHDT